MILLLVLVSALGLLALVLSDREGGENGSPAYLVIDLTGYLGTGGAASPGVPGLRMEAT